MVIGLLVILAVVLIGPMVFKPIEHNLELFFLGAGAIASIASGQMGWSLLHEAATTPIALTVAVFVFSTTVRVMRPSLDRCFAQLPSVMSARAIYFLLIVVLGLLASVITAVVAALVLVEVIDFLGLDRRSEVVAVVLACFAIGMGSALTPMGGPLAMIAIAALRAHFWYLACLIGPLVVASILIVGFVSFSLPAYRGVSLHALRNDQTWSDIVIRSGKVYVFCAGLVGLSWGFRPVADMYASRLPDWLLFWVNSISAVVDNAALAGAELGPSLSAAQQRAVLMALLISGGMLIPGNIPNIVAAGRLGISSREWARVGLVIGPPLMLLCFAVLRLMA